MTRGRSIVLLVLGSLLLLMAAAQTWISVILPDSGVSHDALNVAGTDASQPVAALAIVAVAAAMASAVGGRRARLVSLALVALASAGAAALSLSVWMNPDKAASGKIAESIGLSGQHAGATATATLWPLMAALLGAVTAVLAAVVLVMSRTWADTAKYRTVSQGADADAERARREKSDEAKGRTTISTRQAESIDDWDDLTRGEDPTA